MDLIAALALAAAAPVPADCQALLGPLYDQPEDSKLPGLVQGATLKGSKALVELRRARGASVIPIRGGDFSGADLRGARLDRICFLGTRLTGSQLRGARLSGSAFVGADLGGADLRETHMSRILFRNTVLKNADARRSILKGGRFDGGWSEGSVEGFRLDWADLTGFRFDCGITLDDGCPIDGGRLTLPGAILRDSNLAAFVDVAGARIDRTRVSPIELPDLRNARLEGPVIVTGGDEAVELSAEEYRSLLPYFRDPAEAEEPPGDDKGGERLGKMPPGTILYFVDHPQVFADGFRTHPLYPRLLPALIASAWSRLSVRFNRDGTIDATGEAVGANAHSCSLGGKGLRFDPATGWYSGTQESGPDVPAPWRGKPIPVLRFQGDRADVWRIGRGGDGEGDPRESDFASCGARAAFSPMIRVRPANARVERLLESRTAAEGP